VSADDPYAALGEVADDPRKRPAAAPEDDPDPYAAFATTVGREGEGQYGDVVETVDVPASDYATEPGIVTFGRNFGAQGLGFLKGRLSIPDLLVQSAGTVGAAIIDPDGLGPLAEPFKRTAVGGFLDNAADQFRNPITLGRTIDYFTPDALRPRDDMERAYATVAEGLGGVAGGFDLARLADKFGTKASKTLADLLRDAPGAQTVGATAGAVAGEVARAAGAPIPVQVAANIVAGTAAPTAAGVATEAVVNPAVGRLTGRSTREAAAMALQQAASDKTTALRRIDARVPPISGAQPTLAEVTVDPGIAGLQRVHTNSSAESAAQIDDRIKQNQLARQRVATGVMGSGAPVALTNAATDRFGSTSAAIDAALGRVGEQVAPEDVGRMTREQLAAAAQDARARASALYQNLPGGDEVLVLRPPEAADVVPAAAPDTGRAAFQAGREDVMRERAPQMGDSLIAFIRRGGGIKPGLPREGGANMKGEMLDTGTRSELRQSGITARTHPTLVNKNGRDLDDVIQAATEAGYLPEGSSTADLFNAIDREARGEPVFPASRVGDQIEARAVTQRQVDMGEEMSQFGFDPANATDADWDAYYRAATGRGDAAVGVNDDLAQAPQGRLAGSFQSTMMDLRRRFFGDEAPPELKQLYGEILGAERADVRTVENWSQRLRSMSGRFDGSARAYAAGLADAVDGFLRASAPPERREALREAQAAWRDQATRFGTGDIGRTLRTDNFGNYTMRDADVGAAVVPRGRAGGEVAGRLIDTAGADAAEAAARSELRRALDAAGRSPAAVARVRQQYGDALRQFPALDDAMREATESAALAEAFSKSPLARFADPNVDPVSEVVRLLDANDGGRKVRSLAAQVRGNEEATAGLRRAFAMYIQEKGLGGAVTSTGAEVPSTPKMLRAVTRVLLRGNEAGALTSEQRVTLSRIRRELLRQKFAETAARASGSDTAMNANYATKLLRMGAALSSRVGKATPFINMALEAMDTADDVRALVTTALLDPSVAADLLRTPTPDRIARLGQAIEGNAKGAAMSATTMTTQE